ncbi:hypothetical protein [Streptomyces coffeae]|nr:hypothetical protein [Streptomyces coffeae]
MRRRVPASELAAAIKVATGTAWNTLKEHGTDPAPERDHTT